MGGGGNATRGLALGGDPGFTNKQNRFSYNRDFG